MGIKQLLEPKSIAVVGASANPAKVGRQILDNLIAGGFSGKLYPVNLKSGRIAGLKAYASLADLPRAGAAKRLVIMAIPAQAVVGEISRAVTLGLKNFVIISSGFKESGQIGAKLEEDLTVIASQKHLNILGPNCLGFINQSLHLNATFSRRLPQPGGLALISQSGAIGSALLDWFQGQPTGLRHFISLGNKAVLDENDFFNFLAKDKQTKAVALYLESLGQGKRTMKLISSLSKKKPVFILKAGQSSAGQQAALSHTGALAGEAALVSAGLARAGALEVSSLSELFNLLSLPESAWRVTRPEELDVITNAGGPGVLAFDALSRDGLKSGRLLDVGGDANAKRYGSALAKILSSRPVSVLAIFTAQAASQPLETAREIARLSKKYPDSLILTSFVGGVSLNESRRLMRQSGLAVFDYPEEAIFAWKGLRRYQALRSNLKPYNPVKRLAPNPAKPDYLKAMALLRHYGLKTVSTRAYKPNQTFNYPAVLKAVGPEFLHKSELGAVKAGLADKRSLTQSAKGMSHEQRRRLDKPGNYLVVQAQAKPGQELIIGFRRDASFGPMLLVGSGGIYAEVLQDKQLAPAGLSQADALAMIKRLRIYPLLSGARGQASLDVKAAAKALSALSRLAEEHPEISELDINPLIVSSKGAVAADVRIIIKQ